MLTSYSYLFANNGCARQCTRANQQCRQHNGLSNIKKSIERGPNFQGTPCPLHGPVRSRNTLTLMLCISISLRVLRDTKANAVSNLNVSVTQPRRARTSRYIFRPAVPNICIISDQILHPTKSSRTPTY
jgi:hypothetical protein